MVGLGVLGWRQQVGISVVSLGHPKLLLPLQLPLPLMELMESEVLEILTKALQSEPLPQIP